MFLRRPNPYLSTVAPSVKVVGVAQVKPRELNAIVDKTKSTNEDCEAQHMRN